MKQRAKSAAKLAATAPLPLLEREQDRENRKKALLTALIAALILIWAPLPSVGRTLPPATQPDKPDPSHAVIKAKPHQPILDTPLQERRSKRTPMPADMVEPRPEIEMTTPEIEIEPTIATSDALFEPAAPPTRRTQLFEADAADLKQPVILERVKPEYPRLGAHAGMTGSVVLEAVMRADGTIDQIRVIRGIARGRLGFEEAAIKALKEWRFKPGLYRGQPVDVRLNVRIDFTLNR